MQFTCLFIAAILLTSCANGDKTVVQQHQETKPPVTDVRTLTYTVEATLPHDTHAFTQGLMVHNGMFLESTGQTGQSTIRHVDIKTGRVLKKFGLPPVYFGEGSTVIGDKAYMLTYLHQTGFIFDATTLQMQGTFSYFGEGWGLTTDSRLLIMSNGTSVLSFIDPATFLTVRTVNVTERGDAVMSLNELEWVDGKIWANIWRSDRIVRIDPNTGVVDAEVDLSGLLPSAERTYDTDVLNGIAYDAASGLMYVTGKNWPHVYALRIAQ